MNTKQLLAALNRTRTTAATYTSEAFESALSFAVQGNRTHDNSGCSIKYRATINAYRKFENILSQVMTRTGAKKSPRGSWRDIEVNGPNTIGYHVVTDGFDIDKEDGDSVSVVGHLIINVQKRTIDITWSKH